MNDSQLYTEALNMMNKADMDLLEVIAFLVKTYKVSQDKARQIAMQAEAHYCG